MTPARELDACKAEDMIEVRFDSQEGESRKMSTRLEAAMVEAKVEDGVLGEVEARLEQLQAELLG